MLLFRLSTKWSAATRFIDQSGKYATAILACEDVWRLRPTNIYASLILDPYVNPFTPAKPINGVTIA